MPTVDFVVHSDIEQTPRVRILGSMFDCPVGDKSELRFNLEFPFDSEDWNCGVIVGPSGSGKSSVMRDVFGEMPSLEWSAKSLVDDFDKSLSVDQISQACSSVGFNTIPAWLRPKSVLSNGEQFRVDLARRLLELPDPIVVDEFTSVVDRQVAQIGSHAVQRYIRKHGRKLVAVTCHYDVIDWLQPDWVLDMATKSFTRRLVQRRPAIECVVGRIPYAAWDLFSNFHYMSEGLNRAARCFGLWANGRLAAFAGVLHRPHPNAKNLKAVSRLVTLPDWQGLGLAMALCDHLGAAYKATGFRLRTYPAHPSLIRSFDHSKAWRLDTKPGLKSKSRGHTTSLSVGTFRPCAVFEYAGPRLDNVSEAQRMLG